MDDYNNNVIEQGLPLNLKRDIQALVEGEKNKVSYVDCLHDELYGSVNADFWAGNITEQQANYIRNKYLFQ